MKIVPKYQTPWGVLHKQFDLHDFVDYWRDNDVETDEAVVERMQSRGINPDEWIAQRLYNYDHPSPNTDGTITPLKEEKSLSTKLKELGTSALLTIGTFIDERTPSSPNYIGNISKELRALNKRARDREIRILRGEEHLTYFDAFLNGLSTGFSTGLWSLDPMYKNPNVKNMRIAVDTRRSNSMYNLVDRVVKNASNKDYIGAFVSGTKPMMWDIPEGIDPKFFRSYLALLGMPIDLFKGHHYADLLVNPTKLKLTILNYKSMYTTRLGLPAETSVDEIYNYLKLNSSTILNGYIEAPYQDLLGISLGFGPKDALMFNFSNPERMLKYYNNPNYGWPYLVAKYWDKFDHSGVTSTINGSHMTYPIIK